VGFDLSLTPVRDTEKYFAVRSDVEVCANVAQVTEDGKYVPPPPSNQKASYATMVYVRATIVEGAGWALARSVTIAVSPKQRYCAQNPS
jgi:hypothetical protein